MSIVFDALHMFSYFPLLISERILADLVSKPSSSVTFESEDETSLMHNTLESFQGSPINPRRTEQSEEVCKLIYIFHGFYCICPHFLSYPIRPRKEKKGNEIFYGKIWLK